MLKKDKIYQYWILSFIVFGFLLFNLFVMASLARAESSEEISTVWQPIGGSYTSISSNQTGIGQTFQTSANQTVINEIYYFGGGDNAEGSVYNCYIRNGFAGSIVGSASSTVSSGWVWRTCDFGSVAVATGTTYAFEIIRDSGTEAKAFFYTSNVYAGGSARVYGAWPATFTAYADRDFTFAVIGSLLFPECPECDECPECPECDECSSIIPTTTAPAISEGIDGSIFSMFEFYTFLACVIAILIIAFGVINQLINGISKQIKDE